MDFKKLQSFLRTVGPDRISRTMFIIVPGLFMGSIALIAAFPQAAPYTLIAGMAGIWVTLMFVSTRSSEQIKAVDKKAELTHLRGRRLEPILRNTAGSVGRLAPIVRNIDSKFAQAQLQLPSAQTQRKSSGQHAGKDVPVDDQKLKSLPPAPAPNGTTPNSHITALVIADPFTLSALRYEWNQLEPTPDNWKLLLDSNQVNLLFVESAWEGNGGSWRFHFTGQSAPRPAIVELVKECQLRGIPTVFWNKEDPPHFTDFLETAELFDWVYTTEEQLVDDYRTALGHERVGVLPFAASPFLHNPARIGKLRRDRNIVFGGMYFRHKYPERRSQMDYLLPAAASHGLDIFSRQLGGDPNYQFPPGLDGFVRGELSYPQMVTAYHAYKVVLNVNSVPDSKSMCARRIFEATACGAAVVTPDTPAISEFFSDNEMSVVTSESDAGPTIRSLVRSDSFRQRRVHLAQRRIWENHTYSHRVNRVLDPLGLSSVQSHESVSVVVTTIRPDCLSIIFENFSRQSWQDKELVLLFHGFEVDQKLLQDMARQYGIPMPKFLVAPKSTSLGENLNRLTAAAEGSFIVRMDDDDWYGANYVRDLVNAAHFSRAQLVGKAASYIYFEGLNATILSYAAHEHRYTDFIRGATFAGPSRTFREVQFPHIPKSEDSGFIKDLLGAGGQVYSADRFNFLVRRHVDKAKHTWGVNDLELFASGDMVYVGDGLDQIEI